MAGTTQVIILIGTALIIVFCFQLLIRHTPPFAVVLGGVVVAGAFFAVVPPQESMDMYAYGYFGHLITAYSHNPYTVSPDACSQDPYLRLARTPRPIQSPYGPGWTAISTAILSITGDHTGATIIIFRAIAICALLGSIMLLRQLLGTGLQTMKAITLFAWNPLVLFEVINNGHNDIVLVFLLLCAIFLYRQKKYFWIVPVLAAAFLVKFVAILAAPLFLIAFLRDTTLQKRDWQMLAISSAASVAISVATFLPFWRGFGTFHYLIFLAQYIGLPLLHPLTFGMSLLRFAGVPERAVPTMLLLVGRTLFGIIALWAALRLWKNGSNWLPASFGVLLAGFLGFGLTYFEPWYLLWLLPFVFFWPRRTWEGAVFLITLIGLAGTTLVS